jgi:pimeloyl-ACP methyl ester carboxylesterase
VPAGFTSSTTTLADGSVLHAVVGGSGSAVVLLHGFPEDWSAWRAVMPLLAAEHTVVAIDLPGLGGSTAAGGAVDVTAQATRVGELVEGLGLTPAYVVGHDIGGSIAYAMTRLRPDRVSGLMLVEAPLEGMPTWIAAQPGLGLWHIAFHQTPDLPEAMIPGHEAVYFRSFLDGAGGPPEPIADDDLARYVAAYDEPDELAALLGMYRAMPAASQFDTAHTEPLAVPITVVGGGDAFGALAAPMAADLRAWGATDVSSQVVDGAGHYVADDQPDALATLIAAAAP